MRRSTRFLLLLGLTVPLAAGLLAGCGQAVPGKGETPVTTTPSSGPSASSGSGQPFASPTAPQAPAPKAGALTVRGRVSPGVEPGCMILAAEQGEVYLLVGGDRSVLRPGNRVEVVGVLQPGLMTTCQQGTPLTVQRARVV
ncbi:MAG TPA: hypothetical protein VGR21_02370 [Cryptosporangiaceae bacterium]|nr:hypothetical protein [Cryptosporangiaceae bacterium]